MTKETLLQRVDDLFEMGKVVLGTKRSITPARACVDAGVMEAFRSASLSFIQQVYDQQHPYYSEFSEKTTDCWLEDATRGLGVLAAIRREIAGDWLFTVRGRVTAEVFADYMEMAEYLLDSIPNGQNPSAVIAGSTLEEHLRQLCRKNGIPVVKPKAGKDDPLTGGSLNDELARKGVYNTNQQKAITGWLGIRNSAAHGKYGEYTAGQVKGMIAGIREFMGRVSV